MRTLIAIATLVAAAAAQAGPADVVRKESRSLEHHLEACAIGVRTIYVKIRGRLPMEKEDDVSGCVADGKESVSRVFGRLKGEVPEKASQALLDLRLEWMAAFDGSAPQENEIERDYLKRQVASKQAIARALNKLEIAAE